MLVYLHIIPSKSNLPSEQLTPIPQEFNPNSEFSKVMDYLLISKKNLLIMNC